MMQLRSRLRGAFADRSTVTGDFLNTFFGRQVATVVGILPTILVPVLLGPASYGVWKLLTAIENFSRVLHLGTVSALNRQVPYYEGRGDPERARTARGTALGMTILGGLVSSAGVIVAALWVRGGALLVPLLLFAGYSFANRLLLYYQTLFNAERLFGSKARIGIIEAAISTPIVLAGVYFFGLSGVIAASTVVLLVVVGLHRRRLGTIVTPSIDRRELRASIGVGLPVLLYGIVGYATQSTDTLMVGWLLGASHVGLYALGVSLAERLGQLAWMLGSVMMPRFARRYGEQEEIGALREMVEQPARFVGVVFPALSLAAIASAEVLFLTVWKSYRPGRDALTILALGVMLVAVYDSYAGFFATIKKQIHLVWMLLVALAANVVGNYVLIRAGWGITGAALSTASCMGVFSLAQTTLALRQFSGGESVPRGLARVYAGSAVAVSLVVAGEAILRLDALEPARYATLGVRLAALPLYGVFGYWMAVRNGFDPRSVLRRLREGPPGTTTSPEGALGS